MGKGVTQGREEAHHALGESPSQCPSPNHKLEREERGRQGGRSDEITEETENSALLIQDREEIQK